MESIKELRKLLQEEKIHPIGWKRPLGYKTLQRGLSIYITRLLLPLPIKPDYITILGITIGLVGCWFVFQNPWVYKIIGVCFLYLNTILDRVDGEIARYKKIYSLKGIYLDEINHLIIPSLFFLALAFGLHPFSILKSSVIYTAGALSALSIMIIRITHSLPQQIYIKKFLKNPDLFTLPEKSSNKIEELKKRHGMIRIVLYNVHLLQEFFIILIIFGAVLIIERLCCGNYIFFPI
ncbi:CDP-alcohol phosphatidyltransferase family protein, partial [Patescibacteria group bacterium]